MDRNYEQEYKKAFEAAKGLYDAGNALTKMQMEIVFPQLAESEDERIRKILINIVKGACGKYGVKYKGDEITEEKILAYLEKQKEPHFTKRNALFDKCVENCDPKTVEEVNKRVDDIMDMPELSAFEQALTNFIGSWEDDEERWPSKFVKKHSKRILDIAREELQKEQKPVEHTLQSSWYTSNQQKPSDNVSKDEYIKKFKALCDAYEIKLPNREYDIYHLCDDLSKLSVDSDRQKLVEWNEENERMLSRCIKSIECSKQFADSETYKAAKDAEMNWLKSLRPSWKPSEEQPEVFDTVAFQKGVQEGRRLEREDALSIADIEKLHTFLYAVKNNKHGAFTFARLSNEQYEEVLRRFNKAKEE